MATTKKRTRAKPKRTKAKPVHRKKEATKPVTRRDLNFPLRKGEPVVPRAGTYRAKMLAMLRRGTTVEEVAKACGWSKARARQGVKHVHTLMGYGLKTAADGTIRLIEK